MDTYLAIIQYQSEADQVMLVLNSTQIFYYLENPETGINVMLATVKEEQKQELASKGYIVQTIQTNPDIDKYELVTLDSADQAAFYSNVGKVYVLDDLTALVKVDDDVSVMELGESKSEKILPLLDIRKDLAVKNRINLDEETTQNTTSQSQDNTSNTPQQETIYFLAAIVIFLIFLAAAAFMYFRTHHTDKS